MASITGIYKITNIINGKCYIGQSINVTRRWAQHSKNARTGSTKCAALYEAIRKYGIAAFRFDVVVICNRELLDWHERLAILGEESIAPNGYNLTFGGNECTLVSDTTKLKISNALKGRTKSDQEIANIKAGIRRAIENGHTSWNKGKKLTGKLLEIVVARNKSRIGITAWNKGLTSSDESKRKMSEAHKGKVLSTETKGKIAQAMTGREILWKEKLSKALKGRIVTEETKSKLSLYSQKGQLVVCSNGNKYHTVLDAAKATGALASNITAVCNGRRKSAAGFNFWYEKVV